MNRREFLRSSAQAAAVLAAAACSSSSPGGRSSTTGSLSTASSSTVPTKAPSLDQLAAKLHGRIVTAADADYEVARVLFDPIYDTITPRGVVQAADVADIATVVGVRRDYGTGVAIRGGGHSYGGWSTGSDLVLDVTRLRSITINKAAGTAQVGPGVRLRDLYATLNAQNLTVPGGTCPTVGIAGHALGGGHGLVARSMGLTCDSIQAVDIVTADGQLRHCDATHEPDLFWACRGGGGGSFGVVTGFTFALHPTSTATTFFVRWNWPQAAAALAAWMAWVPTLPAATTTIARLETTPQLVVAGVHLGSRDEIRALLQPLYNAVPPVDKSAGQRSFGDAMLLEAGCLHNRSKQCLPAPPTGASPLLGRGGPFVATSHYFDHALPSGAISAAITAINEHHATAGSGSGTVQFDAYGGAIAQVAPNATAFAHRTAFCSAQYASLWTAGSPDPHRAWLRSTRASMAPWSNGGAYVNYPDPELQSWARAYWGANLPRLQEVKKKYDPENVFSFAQSVPLPR